MSFLRSLMGQPERMFPSHAWDSGVTFNGHTYPVGLNQTLMGDKEKIDPTFTGYAAQIYASNSIVFACMQLRMEAFAEARFRYQKLEKGNPGILWGDASLEILEKPWPGGVTGDMLAREIQYADLAGNSFKYRRGNRLRVLRPDWMTIVLASESSPENPSTAIDAEVIGYIYFPGGFGGSEPPVSLDVSEVSHFAPIPDPLASFRGMSWLTPLIRDIQADGAATTHKQRYFENGATPNMIVKLGDAVTLANYEEWVAKMQGKEPKGKDVYKTLYLAAGSDATVVGSDLSQLDFKNVQGGGETRIAAAAGTPPVLVGLSEGLAGSSLNAGNYGSARRRFSDLTIRPLWRNYAGSTSVVVPPPAGSRLWYDEEGIQFLLEDRKDSAEIQTLQAQAIRQYIDSGFTPESVTKAVEANDLSLLKHSGLVSVQLQPPGAKPEPAPDPAKALAPLLGKDKK